MLEFVLDRMNYWAIVVLMMLGLHIVFASQNLIKRLVGLSIFQTSVFVFYITLGKVTGGTAPILIGKDIAKYKTATGAGHHGAEHGGYGAEVLPDLYNAYSNPLPHVLILTAIVVGVATLAVGLALTVRIRETYSTVEMDSIQVIDMKTAQAEDADDAAEGAHHA